MFNDEDIPRNISSNDGIVVAKTGNKLSLLNIEAVKRRHRGNYTCWAKNKAGISHYSVQLAINGDSMNFNGIKKFQHVQFFLKFAIC